MEASAEALPVGPDAVKKFYVYELRDDTEKVFYVGKGMKHRLRHHRNLAKKGKLKVHFKIRKLWREGRDYHAKVVFRTDSEDAAFGFEKYLIAKHGRKNLTNLTDGGEGPTGLKHTEETKAKLSEIKIRNRPEGFKFGHLKSFEELGVLSMDEEYLHTRFFSKIDYNGPQPDQTCEHYKGFGPCWQWMGTLSNKGAGYTTVSSRRVTANRLSFMLHHQRYVDPKVGILRLCDNRKCVNPHHMIEGSNAVSVELKLRKGRGRGWKCRSGKDRAKAKGVHHYMKQHPEKVRRGETIKHSKLTDEIVREMRSLHASGVAMNRMKDTYGVSFTAVWSAIHRRTWAHVV